jgi:AraC-like DNA-binding protein
VILHAKVFVVIEVIAIAGLFMLGNAGYAIPAFFDIRRTAAKPSTGEPLFPNYDDQKELIRLKQAFEQQALHTRSGLTVEELAGELKLPVKYVSYLINTHHHTNFHYFINSYRVKEVIRKMEDPTEKHKTLLALAMESGFNSKSSFNQVFKSHTGKTPSQFLK